MDNLATARPAGRASDAGVLDETDPHAGDDVDWADDELAAIAVAHEPSFLLFWRGLLLGLLLSAVSWCLLAVAAFALYKLLTH